MIETLFCANQQANEDMLHKVMLSQHQPIKPEGSLGRLEEIVVRLAGHQATDCPSIKKPKVVIFSGQHGMASEDVSEYESSQTELWLHAFQQQETPTNTLAQFVNANVDVINTATTETLKAGTENFTQAPAMSQQQLIAALELGMQQAENAHQENVDLFVSGEIGLANTTSAVAMISVLSGKPAEELLMMGRARLMRSEKHKLEIIQQALERHQTELTSPLRILQHLGGFETAALCGAYIRCAQLGITVVVDGLMATVAAWIADLVSRNDQLLNCQSIEEMMEQGKYSVPETMFCICGDCPRLVEWCFFAHQSAEPYHGLVLEILAVDPILQFDMKLGQASGSTLIIPLLQQACAVYNALPKVELPEENEEPACPI